MKRRLKREYIIGLLAFFVLLFLLQALLMPKYASGIVEGGLIRSYYDAQKGNDVIFIGDCEVYENFSPVELWKEYGITSYIRGSAQQLIWQSYYLMEETLNIEKPEVIVFNVLSMKYDEPQKEEYNRMTLDGMRLSRSKLDSIRASSLEDESLIDYLLPILRYHSRWNELDGEDITYMFSDRKLFHNGYYMRADVKPMDSVPAAPPLADYSFGENSSKYLEMMYQLASENDVELVLVKAPTYYPPWYDQWESQIEDFARERGLLYLNYLELMDETGVDMSTDTYDGGLHMNVFGAEKLSRHLGRALRERFSLEDKRAFPEFQEAWSKTVAFYDDMKRSQLSDLRSLGRIATYD